MFVAGGDRRFVCRCPIGAGSVARSDVARVADDIDGAALLGAPATPGPWSCSSRPWCGPCRKELGELQDIAAADTGLRVILINAFEEYAERSDQSRMRGFLAKQGIAWPVVVGNKELRTAFGNITKIPSLFVFDGQGRELAAFRRQERLPPSVDELRAAIARE